MTMHKRSEHTTTAEITETVREKYGQAALRVVDGATSSCCSPVNSCCGGAAFDGTVDPITANLYINGGRISSQKPPCSRRWDVGIRPQWPSCAKAKPCSI